MASTFSNKTRTKVNERQLGSLVEKFLTLKRLKNREISIVFVGDEKIKRLNKIYRQSDRTTDVLSFYELDDGPEPENNDFLGEVIINLSQVRRQAKDYNHTFAQELSFVLVHGLLHLLGERDYTKKEKEEMDIKTRKILNQIGELR